MKVQKVLAGVGGAVATWLLGIVAALLTLVFAGWHAGVVVLGVSLALAMLLVLLAGQTVAVHFKNGRRGVWALLTFPLGVGLALIALGEFGWRSAVLVVVVGFVLSLVQGGLLFAKGIRAGREFVEETMLELPDLGDFSDEMGGFPGFGGSRRHTEK